MNYPLPPWKFLCLGMTIFYLVPVGKVRDQIPSPLQVSEVVPGFTLGGIYAARYGKGGKGGKVSGSGRGLTGAGVKSEFGVLPAYVRYGGNKGFFMRHFCADKPEGGFGGWGMIHPECGPYDFSWKMDDKHVILDITSGDGERLINISMRPIVRELPFSASFSFLCIKGNNIVFQKNHFASNIGFSASTVDIPKNSPLKETPLTFKLVSAFWDASNIVVNESEYLKEAVIKTPAKALDAPIGRRMEQPRASGHALAP